MNIEELKKYQNNMIRKKRNYNLFTIIGIVLIVGITLYIMNLKHIELPVCIVVAFFETILLIIPFSLVKNISLMKNIATFNKDFKKNFVLSSLKEIFTSIKYQSEYGFDEDEINKIGILDTGDRFSSNDHIIGTYKGIKFEQADIHIEEKHEEKDSNGETQEVWTTLFSGKLMIFDFNKKFKTDIEVLSRHFDANTWPWGKKFSEIKMEDVEFNKMFYVYAENEHDAFYILTPQFMEKIKEVTKKLNTSIMFGFINNKLYIAIDNVEDSFEWNPFKRIDEKEIKENINRDIKLITDLVDYLNLDNDLFKK